MDVDILVSVSSAARILFGPSACSDAGGAGAILLSLPVSFALILRCPVILCGPSSDPVVCLCALRLLDLHLRPAVLAPANLRGPW